MPLGAVHFGRQNAGSRKQEQPKTRGKTPLSKENKVMRDTSSVQQVATSESVGGIDDAIITRFRDSKAEVLKELQEAGTAAGVRFADHLAEYGELRRLERWWSESRDNPRLDLEELGLDGLAKILAGDNGDADDLESHIRELGDSDSSDGRWIECFITGTLERFSKIEPHI
jgi:hypothetical protein